MFGHLATGMGFANVRAGTRVRMLVLVQAREGAIQKGTRVLISLWDSLMFGRVLSRVLMLVLVQATRSAIQKGTRVLISLWDSLMFGRVLSRVLMLVLVQATRSAIQKGTLESTYRDMGFANVRAGTRY